MRHLLTGKVYGDWCADNEAYSNKFSSR